MDLSVVKKDGRSQSFDRDKLARSVFTALRKRPIETDRIERVITGIVRRLEAAGESEVSSVTIGEMVMESLVHLDQVAYIRFASVYRDFRSIDDFEMLLKSLNERDVSAVPTTE